MTRTLTAAELDALTAVMTLTPGSDGAAVAGKLAQANLVERVVECGNLTSGNSFVHKCPAVVGLELQYVYVQADSVTDNVTVNVTKGGSSITSTGAAVAVDDGNDDWQEIPLISTTASRQAGPPASSSTIDQSTEGFTFTLAADGSGAVTKGRICYAYSRI